MKRIVQSSIFLLLVTTALAQPPRQSYPDNTYKDGHREEFKSKNVNSEDEDITEYYDAQKILRARKTATAKANGDTVKTSIIYNCDGSQFASLVKRVDKNGRELEVVYEKYGKNGEIIQGSKTVDDGNPEGPKKYKWDKEKGEFVAPPDVKTFEPGKGFPSIGMEKEIFCGKELKQKSELAGGYSFLYPTQKDADPYPLGGYLTYVQPIINRLALTGDFSIHTRKDGEFQATLAFLMGGVQYQIIRQKAKELRTLMMYSRILAGIALDRQVYKFGGMTSKNKDEAFCYAFGIGWKYPLTQIIAINLAVDYVLTKFAEESLGNVRAGVGVSVNLGQ